MRHFDSLRKPVATREKTLIERMGFVAEPREEGGKRVSIQLLNNFERNGKTYD